MSQLKDKVAVITGGSRGLGFAIARESIREGAAVVIASRSIDSVDSAVRELRNLGGQVYGMSCDTGKLDQVEALASFACQKFGRFDIWVNNGGVSCPTGPTVHVPPEMAISLIHTNIIGVYHGSITAMKYFLTQGSGKLINMVGKGERRPVPLHSAYSSSRAWVRNFTLAMAQEYKTTGVEVFLLNPGLVETDMLQNLHFIEGYEYKLKVLRVVKRILANPPEVPARKAIWLASSATDGRTGLYANSLGPGRVIRGAGSELLRWVRRQPPPPYNPNVELVKPAIDIKIPEKSSRDSREKDPGGYLIHLEDKRPPVSIGNKAMNLWHLRKHGFKVPDTHVLTWDAFVAYQRNGDGILDEIRGPLEKALNPDQCYAVRSSADIEDSPDHSFAGQFTSILDVRGVDQVIKAVQQVWNETQTERLRSYTQKSQNEPTRLRMAVIIQNMVSPAVSGVAFSINPITSLDEIEVEAVQGRGDLLVQEGITPLRWVMKWGNWIEQPEASEIPLELIRRVAGQTQKIARTFKREVDLEWVYDGRELYWVQMRDITAMGKADIYSNKIAREMTPGMVKPLDWSVVVPIKSAVVLNLITQVIGKNDLTTGGLMKAFHYRAYHNLGAFGQIFDSLGMPRESLEIMMGVAPQGAGKPGFKPSPRFIRLLPRIFRFVWDKWTFGRKAEAEFTDLDARAKNISLHPPADLDEQYLIKTVDEVASLNRTLSHYAMVSIMLMQIYNGILRSLLRKQNIDPACIDPAEGLDALVNYDPNKKLAALHRKFLFLDRDLQDQIRDSDYQTLQSILGTEDFRSDVEMFLENFGHLSDRTGVFDTIPWRETPDLILDLIIDFKEPEEASLQKLHFKDLKSKGMRGILLKVFYQRARQFRLYREMYSSLYTYTLMLFRVYYLAIGDRLVEYGLLHSSEDIYYLYDEEIRAFIAAGTKEESFEDLVIQRKHEMERCKDAILPQVIYGNEPPPVIVQSSKKLTGTPTSRGYYTGKIRVVRGIGDFKKLVPGDVLVIPHSDVGWLPLFARAGAVIAESGGMLSHSSIVAREYGIPAVVSVSGALQLCDDMLVSIDGYKGEVHIHD